MRLEPRLEQDELAIARDQEVEHLAITVAGGEPLPHQNAQVTRKRRFRIVDRLILANHAAYFARDFARARLQRRVFQHLVRLDRQRRQRRGKRNNRNEEPQEAHAPYSAGCIADFAAGFGAPTRRRRSDSESAPPSIITTAPNQVSSTSGL